MITVTRTDEVYNPEKNRIEIQVILASTDRYETLNSSFFYGTGIEFRSITDEEIIAAHYADFLTIEEAGTSFKEILIYLIDELAFDAESAYDMATEIKKTVEFINVISVDEYDQMRTAYENIY